jgi:hypothetical protein
MTPEQVQLLIDDANRTHSAKWWRRFVAGYSVGFLIGNMAGFLLGSIVGMVASTNYCAGKI